MKSKHIVLENIQITYTTVDADFDHESGTQRITEHRANQVEIWTDEYGWLDVTGSDNLKLEKEVQRLISEEENA